MKEITTGVNTKAGNTQNRNTQNREKESIAVGLKAISSKGVMYESHNYIFH